LVYPLKMIAFVTLRLHLLGFLLLLISGQQLAQAQGALDLNRLQGTLLSVSNGGSALSALALQGLKANSTPQEAILAQGYEPFRPSAIYQLDSNQALWLKFRIKLDQPLQQHWTLSSPKTFLDRLEMHYQDAQGKWQMQQAGDHIAHINWSIRSLSPQFELPILPAGEHDVLLKVVQNFPQQIPLELSDEKTARIKIQSNFLIAGVALGLLILILVLSINLAVAYRDTVYAWYSLYVLLSMLSLMVYLGLGSYLLWPRSETWPEYSVLFLVLASVVAQLWFCQAMFLRDSQSRRFKNSAKLTAALGIVLLGVLLLNLPVMTRIAIFCAGMLVCLSMVGAIVWQAWRKRMVSAYLWLLAYVPLVVTVFLATVDNLSFVDPLGLPYALPAYALTFEAIVLLFSLHIHAKTRHAVQERERALASIDPLTGFLNPRLFRERLMAQWSTLASRSQDMALAFVYVTHSSEQADAESTLKLEAKLLRSVRLMRTITRDVDLIGRIGGNLMAVAMPGIPMGDELNNRLARLVALGLMKDRYDTQPIELRFRIAVGTLGTWGDDLAALDNSLRGSIMQSNGWSSKPIRYITASD
jgi:two-component system, sensor histidine kinase LadS